MEHAFSTRLLHISLFTGFSRLDFIDIVGQTPFDFRTFRPGQVLVKQDAESQSLCLLLSGEVESEVDSPDHSYRLKERLSAPWIVQPECLFGLHNRYSRTIRALSEVQVVMLSKQSVLKLMTDYPTFQINFYNGLSTVAQQANRFLWQTRGRTIEARFRNFLLHRSLRPRGFRELHIRMEDLAVELGTTRLRISQMLAAFTSKGLLTHSRGDIRIPEIEKL